MPHAENLRVPTHEEAVRNGRKAGIASGKAKLKRRAMKEILQELLNLPMEKGKKKEALKSYEDLAKQKNLSIEQAILAAQIVLAIGGDTRAATFIRDTAGEKITKDASDNNQEYEDDGFTEAIKASAKGVWD